MKNLFIFLLIVACAGLYFHDKQQSAHLARALDANDQLTRQLAASQSAVATLQNNVPPRAPAAPVYQAQSAYQNPLAAPQNSTSQRGQQSGNPLQMDQLNGPNGIRGGGGLNRPAY